MNLILTVIISLAVLAGGPIAAADKPNTVNMPVICCNQKSCFVCDSTKKASKTINKTSEGSKKVNKNSVNYKRRSGKRHGKRYGKGRTTRNSSAAITSDNYQKNHAKNRLQILLGKSQTRTDTDSERDFGLQYTRDYKNFSGSGAITINGNFYLGFGANW